MSKICDSNPVICCRKLFNGINYVTFHSMMCGSMRLATLKFEVKLQKCFRIEIIIFKISFREVYRRIYVRKSHFTAPLVRHRKTKFPTVYPRIYLPKLKFEYSFPLNDFFFIYNWQFVIQIFAMCLIAEITPGLVISNSIFKQKFHI